MAEIKVGDKLRRCPSVNVDFFGRALREPMPCEVVYIHPARRYYIAQFEFQGRAFRESFSSGWYK